MDTGQRPPVRIEPDLIETELDAIAGSEQVGQIVGRLGAQTLGRCGRVLGLGCVDVEQPNGRVGPADRGDECVAVDHPDDGRLRLRRQTRRGHCLAAEERSNQATRDQHHGHTFSAHGLHPLLVVDVILAQDGGPATAATLSPPLGGASPVESAYRPPGSPHHSQWSSSQLGRQCTGSSLPRVGRCHLHHLAHRTRRGGRCTARHVHFSAPRHISVRHVGRPSPPRHISVRHVVHPGDPSR